MDTLSTTLAASRTDVDVPGVKDEAGTHNAAETGGQQQPPHGETASSSHNTPTVLLCPQTIAVWLVDLFLRSFVDSLCLVLRHHSVSPFSHVPRLSDIIGGLLHLRWRMMRHHHVACYCEGPTGWKELTTSSKACAGTRNVGESSDVLTRDIYAPNLVGRHRP
ncbi:hypothetical protein MRX96_021990 [Rhipicephalus microplus]